MNSPKLRATEQRIRLPSAQRKVISQQTKSAFDDVTRRKNIPRTGHYWTSGHREYSAHKRNLESEQSPFAFPTCSQTLAYLQWWKARKKAAICERGKGKSYETSQFSDLLERLHVDVEIDADKTRKHKDQAIAMTDVDPHYFTELSGRPVKEKFSLEQYIQDTREVLKTRLLIGQENDECIRIDQQFEEELHRLREIQHRNQRYMSDFEVFLSKDHEKSMRILEQAEREIKLTEAISSRRNELSKEFGQIRLKVYSWEENWRMVKLCQTFLYRTAPTAWRVQHDWLHQSESGRSLASITDSIDVLSKYKTPADDVTLEDLIERFEEDSANAGPAELYFEDPFDLIRIFRAMETQNLSALIHLESLAAPMADMAVTINVIETRIKTEIMEITSTIDDLQNRIIETEDRAAKLEQYADYLLRDVFRNLVCSEEVLYLCVFVEHTYESCVGPNDANLDIFTMMKWIERIHEELNLQLDNLPHDVVRACEREGFREEMKAMKEAEDAYRKFELMHRLLDVLKHIMEPPITKKRPLVRRSAPIVSKMKPVSLLLQPTDEEIQYLTFFTDYCKRDDFIAYRTKFPDDFDLSFKSKRAGTSINEATTLVTETITDERSMVEGENDEEKRNERTNGENVTESTDLFENSSYVNVPKDRLSLTHYASSIT